MAKAIVEALLFHTAGRTFVSQGDVLPNDHPAVKAHPTAFEGGRRRPPKKATASTLTASTLTDDRGDD